MTAKTDALSKLSTAQSLINDIVDDVTAIDDSGTGGSCPTWLAPCDYDLNEQSVYFDPSVHIPAMAAHWNSMTTYFSRMATNIPDGAVLFIGDSNIQGMCTSAINPHSVNMGIGGDIMRGVIHRTKTYEPLSRAGCVVIWIGTNDFYAEGANWLGNMQLMVTKIMNHFDGGPVIYCTIPPIASGSQSGYFQQANIDTINAYIVSQAPSYPHVTVLDTATPLKNGTSYLHSSYSLDGIHLNAAGQAMVMGMIETATEGL
jgi:lysophospholipase L1-like esterase